VRVAAVVVAADAVGAHLVRVGQRRHLLAPAQQVGKGRRVLGLEADDDESVHDEVVDDAARKGHPLVLEVLGEDGLEVDRLAVAAHDDAAAEQLADEDLARGLDAGRGVVEVLERAHGLAADLDLAGRARVDGVERRRDVGVVLAALFDPRLLERAALALGAEVHFVFRSGTYAPPPPPASYAHCRRCARISNVRRPR
jgi:hypothetical protein